MLWWLAETALLTGLLAGLVSLVCRLGRLGPSLRHALWLVVLVKFVTPPFLQWPWALPGVGEAPPVRHVVAEDRARPIEESPSPLLEMVVTGNDPASGEDPPLPLLSATEHQELRTTDQAENALRQHVGWLPSLLRNLWLSGTAAMCLLQVFRIARFRRLLARTDPAPPWLQKLVAMVADTLRVRRPSTLIVPGIGSPFIWSLGRPKLLWPSSLLEHLPHHGQRGIVAHELAHLRRRDHWVGWLQLVAECVWWWNPCFWYVRRQLRLNAELACDAWVVSTLPEDRRAYAEALIEVTQLISQTAAPLPALGIKSAARQDFERRLTMIMRDRVPCRVPLVGLLASGLLALVSLPGWSQTRAQVKEVLDVKQAPAPEKQLILEAASDVDYVINVQEGQKTGDDTGKNYISVADPAAPSDRDRRLQKLEEQLQELLKEVQALRGGGAKREMIFKTRPDVKTVDPRDAPKVRIIESKRSEIKHDPVDAKPVPKPDVIIRAVPLPHIEHLKGTVLSDGKIVREVTLSRVTYNLPHAKAEALANLLTQHSKRIEAKVEGDSLIITTTPEAQKAITPFVLFIQGETAAVHFDTKSVPALKFELKDGKHDVFRLHDVEEAQKSTTGEKKDN